MSVLQQTTPTPSRSVRTPTSITKRKLYGGTNNSGDVPEVSFSEKNGTKHQFLSSPLAQDRNEPKLSLKEQFARVEANSKCLLQSAMEKVGNLKRSSMNEQSSKDKNNKEQIPKVNLENEEREIQELFQKLKSNLREMKLMSEDMNTLQQVNRNLSPRIVDQIKTWELAVDGLHVSLRKLTMDFQHILNSKRRDDLLSLSRSPFEDTKNSSIRKRAPGDISTNTTDTLARSRNILFETVQRSTSTLEQLAQSSLTIVNTQEDLKEQNTVVSTSRKLLSKYGRREYTDRVLICLALGFFFTVVAYIAQKRIF